ncbi:MAG: hypothetical protein KGJ09_03440 [Candidatus Omnitrophica bacterium]|nr:hypothetical protein [Candidatus Omnitrophota bacterium]MDE2009112.1 hypothetical protein [Candidatus Omnitrophota bacterium]MDE2214223.1 hypothetical protein [Candidatus Omnitrophota bacterium]MDE2231260.1 hypothetical protein [Candidatus Omnitrophota bacterium]
MRYCILLVLLLAASPVSAQNAAPVQTAMPVERTWIHNVLIKGFVLDNRGQFVKLFRPYRNKRLSSADMGDILQHLQEIYEEAGYQGLVSINYHVRKKYLIFTVSLIK